MNRGKSRTTRENWTNEAEAGGVWCHAAWRDFGVVRLVRRERVSGRRAIRREAAVVTICASRSRPNSAEQR